MREVDDQIANGEIELADEVKMKLTKDEKIAHANAWRTHRETIESLKKSRGKVDSLLLGQCTQVLVNMMKQGIDWVMISELFDPILLFKLIEKFVLKQSDNQYRTAVLIAKQLSILSFRHDDHLGNAAHYDSFTTKVEVARHTGVCHYSSSLLEDKATQLKLGDSTSYQALTRRRSLTKSSRSTWPIYSSTTTMQRCTSSSRMTWRMTNQRGTPMHTPTTSTRHLL
jgi:hypothetical protein